VLCIPSQQISKVHRKKLAKSSLQFLFAGTTLLCLARRFRAAAGETWCRTCVVVEKGEKKDFIARSAIIWRYAVEWVGFIGTFLRGAHKAPAQWGAC
jgi:hypothetical protein